MRDSFMGFNKILVCLCVIVRFFTSPAVFAEQTNCIGISEDWRFHTDISSQGFLYGWHTVSFDDSSWDLIDAAKSYKEQGFSNYNGDSWYRKYVDIPSDWNGRRIQFEIGMVDNWCTIYINGNFAIRTAGRINIDISSYLQYGSSNLICCKIEDIGGDGGLTRNPTQLIVLDPTVTIGLSKAVPVINKPVTVTVYENGAQGRTLRITSPLGQTSTVPLDQNAEYQWLPERYGQYILTYNTFSRNVWVTIKPLMFHYWDESVLPKYATHVIGWDNRILRTEYWKNRGVKILAYGSGYGFENATAKSVNTTWSKVYSQGIYNGLAIDEICPDLRKEQLVLAEAIRLAGEQEGTSFEITPYVGGLAYDNYGGFWDLRRAGVKALWENYWGDEDLYLKRWLDIKLTRMDELGGVLCISPGFKQDHIHGSLTIKALRNEFAVIRKIAPDMSGLGFFNGYFRRDLDEACSGFIEDFYLKPVIHIHPKNGMVEFQNIGNEDTPSNITATFYGVLDVSKGRVKLPVLTPWETYLVTPPSNSKRIVLKTPPGIENIYEDGSYTLPSVLNPLQVVSSSIQENAEITLKGDDPLTLNFTFNKTISSFDTGDILLTDSSSQTFTANSAVYDSASKTLNVAYNNLPSGYFSMALLSSNSAFKDTSGNPLDGSGDGMLATGTQFDHYTLYFRVVRASKLPVKVDTKEASTAKGE